ncbi:MAG: undecaprenyldiphospho-muramoylpentapeptide beta-N-acetylglucosaminyltransferase [Gammaproteobacteria bacterium]
MKRPIMIMAGGTGGHVFPALAVADYLHEKEIPLLWLGTKKGLEARVVPEADHRLLTLTISGVRGVGFLKLLIAPFKILLAVFQAIKIMINHRPAAVLGMGGFASGPGGIAAWLMRIPVVIHEQNAIAGMTNKYLAKIATRVFTAFPNTFDNRNEQHVGNPVRASIVDLKKQTKNNDQIRILIVGGSLGASSLNTIVPHALSQITNKKEYELNIWHQTGQGGFDQTQKQYKALKIKARVEPFLDDIDQAYGWADFVICRSGALTVSELAAAGLPSILVPYPHAVDDHQTMNAGYLVDADAAVIIPDSDLTKEKLASIINDWIDNPGKLIDMSNNAKKVAMTGATERVSNALLEVAYG